MSEKISIYIPAYNAENTIEQTIDSILQQTINVDEIIVVNDNSTDCTEEIVKKFSKIKILNNKKNMGLGFNRNLAIKESNGDEIILPSGLKIMIIEDKDGLSPQLSDTVTTEILITDLDGKILQEFTEPQNFVLSQVFPGLTEGIRLMNIGDKWKLTIPPELANGSGETVIFQVELLGIN